MRVNQAPPFQRADRMLHRTLRQTGIERNLLQAGHDAPAPHPLRPASHRRPRPQIQKDQEG
jgi:hypothetical protein